jgi:hypothetical protein
MQRAFISFACEWVSATISNDPELQTLKPKLANVADGRPSSLPPTADLRLVYYELMRQLQIARQKIAEIRGRRSITDDTLLSDFLTWAPSEMRWVHLLRTGKLPLEAIISGSVEAASKSILALSVEVSEDAVHSRLFRRG